MFGSKKTASTTEETKNVVNARSTVSANENALNSLVRGTKVEGTITADSDIRIDGTIKGTLVCTAKVIIGPSGLIDGEVKCQNAVIEGKFYGILRVSELLSIKETAEVVGDVTTAKLSVAPGAIFDVTCKMKAETKPHPKPVKEETIQANGATKK
ncbi:MAG: polymer-forming cytoskeletal protein [Saprospiraceae bacterium]|nr:polymer-forming cytoskeletal protein [Saprospiraceae bacterium]